MSSPKRELDIYRALPIHVVLFVGLFCCAEVSAQGRQTALPSAFYILIIKILEIKQFLKINK